MVWLWFAVMQIAIITVAAFLFTRPRKHPYLWFVLVPLSVLVLLINLGWLASGGMDGSYAAFMRGGMPGFWATTVIFFELLLLGIAVGLGRPRR